MNTLKKGSTGSDVKTLQTYLNLEQDGIFGTLTEEMVKEFQKNHNLTADGVVGPATWEAITGKFDGVVASRKIKAIILHCSATREGQNIKADTIRKWHVKDRGWADIGYHYVVDLDGTIEIGRNINSVGAHCEGHNSGTIGICYVGGLDADGKKAKDTRTPEQKKALVTLVNRLCDKYGLAHSDIHCHNEFSSKACPSFNINDFRKEL